MCVCVGVSFDRFSFSPVMENGCYRACHFTSLSSPPTTRVDSYVKWPFACVIQPCLLYLSHRNWGQGSCHCVHTVFPLQTKDFGFAECALILWKQTWLSLSELCSPLSTFCCTLHAFPVLFLILSALSSFVTSGFSNLSVSLKEEFDFCFPFCCCFRMISKKRKTW